MGSFEWAELNKGEKFLIASTAVATMTLFMPWIDIGIASATGWEELGFLFAALLVYPTYLAYNRMPAKRGLAITLGILAVVLSGAYIASNLGTVEADGVLFDEDQTIDVNGFGVYIFLLSSITFTIGAWMNQRRDEGVAQVESSNGPGAQPQEPLDRPPVEPERPPAEPPGQPGHPEGPPPGERPAD